MNPTYTPLATTTLGSSQTTVTFSSIANTYTDLILQIVFKVGASTYQPYITVNGDSNSVYSTTSLRGNGSAVSSGRHSNVGGWFPIPGVGIGTNGDYEIWTCNFMNYSNSAINKPMLSRFSNPNNYAAADIHLYRGSTNPITSISVTAESGTNDFLAGSTFTLYGIA